MNIIIFIIIHFQLLMVVGGDGGEGSTRLDTTEVYEDNEWKTVSGKLPRAMADMAVTTINDKILLFGI